MNKPEIHRLRVFSSLLLLLSTSALPALSQTCVITGSASPAAPIPGQPFTITASIAEPPGENETGIVLTTLQSALLEFGSDPEPIPISPSSPVKISESFTSTIPTGAGLSVIVSRTSEVTPGTSVCSGSASIPVEVSYSNLLVGRYAIKLDGFLQASPSGTPSKVVLLGSLNASGGNITGTVDYNTPLGSQTAVPITGTYSLNIESYKLGINNYTLSGTMTLQTPLGPESFAITAPGVTNITDSGPLPLSINSSSLSANYVTLQSNNANGFYANGFMAAESAPPASLSDAVVSYQGEASCGDGSQCILPQPPQASGYLGTTTGSAVLTSIIDGLQYTSQSFGITTTAVDQTTGRFTYTLESLAPYQPTHFVGYFTDANHFYTMSTDSHQEDYLFYGAGSQ